MSSTKAWFLGVATIVLSACTGASGPEDTAGATSDAVQAAGDRGGGSGGSGGSSSGSSSPPRCDLSLTSVDGPVDSVAVAGPFLGPFFVAHLEVRNRGTAPMGPPTMTVSDTVDGVVLAQRTFALGSASGSSVAAPGGGFAETLNLGREAGDARYFGRNVMHVELSCVDASGAPAHVDFAVDRASTPDDLSSCGNRGLSSPRCEWNGNGACGGAGPRTLDCAHCCEAAAPLDASSPPTEVDAPGWACGDSEYAGAQYWTCSAGAIYRCEGGAPRKFACAQGCDVGPLGTDDACR